MWRYHTYSEDILYSKQVLLLSNKQKYSICLLRLIKNGVVVLLLLSPFMVTFKRLHTNITIFEYTSTYTYFVHKYMYIRRFVCPFISLVYHLKQFGLYVLINKLVSLLLHRWLLLIIIVGFHDPCLLNLCFLAYRSAKDLLITQFLEVQLKQIVRRLFALRLYRLLPSII